MPPLYGYWCEVAAAVLSFAEIIFMSGCISGNDAHEKHFSRDNDFLNIGEGLKILFYKLSGYLEEAGTETAGAFESLFVFPVVNLGFVT